MENRANLAGDGASQAASPPRRRMPMLLLALMGLLLLSITFGITLGPVEISPASVWRIAGHELALRLGIASAPGEWTLAQHQIVWLIRMPRVLLAALVGAGLAVVGVTMQAMVRNPLADPYLLGVSSGASVGAVLVLAYGVLGFAGVYALSLGAFAGALLACVAVYWLAHSGGRLLAPRLILGGVAIGYCLGGITSLVTLTAGQRELANAVLSWTLGSLAGTRWDELGLPALVLALGIAWLLLQARALNALLTGDETASTLGVDTTRVRRVLFVLVSLLTGVMVAVSGAIGFIGLMVPHITRMLVGTEHRRVLPVAALVGAVFLVWVDAVARVAFAPTELPVGIITALIGGPFFVWLLLRRGLSPGAGR
ncbi:FecCD family ABC transporter permease [Thauera linaloolentis]|uniref:Transport system permease n=1 Tax=Thauera linaloolentis (strain DSM 12138 / JCM 21573 / CCUG 41526 / CIP 105981 / IAM 15112 / NBRC 102519 / 47Lol) TaxID=1123367 RepID=N6Y5V3_THAL4|nr:iron ABC transporter permease [Thauera linaloolentis]ENO86965.1 transport system permease [Thauera linaloolentis 47Lol = DSM 12138]MCM8564424.1 iron ABC transporter permease [Thauera linaloolentis]